MNTQTNKKSHFTYVKWLFESDPAEARTQDPQIKSLYSLLNQSPFIKSIPFLLNRILGYKFFH
ncbi:hypothetical protein SPPR111872_19110 [Sphingobacterium prati]